jgi:hypothetical protein
MNFQMVEPIRLNPHDHAVPAAVTKTGDHRTDLPSTNVTKRLNDQFAAIFGSSLIPVTTASGPPPDQHERHQASTSSSPSSTTAQVDAQ